MKCLLSLTFLALFASASCIPVQLIVREAGTKGRIGPVLRSGTTFCPRLFVRGFSVECQAPSTARSARFFVNGHLQRREFVAPFMVAGDHDGIILPWNAFKRGKNVIKCLLNNGESVTAEVNFSCADSPQSKSTSAGKEMSEKNKKKKEEVSEKRRKLPVQKKPLEAPQFPPTSTGSCTTISATNYVGTLAKGWEAVNDGLFYKKDDPFEGVVPSNTALVTYKFTPPETSKYALVLDMTTTHVTEHNGKCSMSPPRTSSFVLDLTNRHTLSFRRLLPVNNRWLDASPLRQVGQSDRLYEGLPQSRRPSEGNVFYRQRRPLVRYHDAHEGRYGGYCGGRPIDQDGNP